MENINKLELPIKNPAKFMPHSGKMVLIDEIIQFDKNSLTASAKINKEHIFLDGRDEFSSVLGLEIMAQGVACYAGIGNYLNGEKVRLGFLLGTRKLNIHQEKIKLGTQLVVLVKKSWSGDGMGLFDCTLAKQTADDLTEIMNAALNVYSPNDEQMNSLLGK
ncbi:MAG: thioester dehydrase [Cardiobacteriaceae bacterium]|nr:thioester dehydrase [Cardiobacteriaceae bacterium]